MSVIPLYLDIPYPNFPMEEALAPNQVRPVREVAPVVPVRSVEPREKTPLRETPAQTSTATGASSLEVSAAGRNLALQVTGQKMVADRELRDPASVAQKIRNNISVRELIGSFASYDNHDARVRFDNYLKLFVNLASDTVAAKEEKRALDEVRVRENALYASLGFLPANIGIEGSVVSQRMAVAIDEWLRGNGVFIPSMLSYASSDGFRFVPLTGASRGALRAADMLASYDRLRIAQYLREMAALTPEDFMFYDPTGLGALPLKERGRFLAQINQYLEQLHIDARASELRYVFTRDGRLLMEELGLKAAELKRLETFREVINSYYSMLIASVRQYGAGVVSSSMGSGTT